MSPEFRSYASSHLREEISSLSCEEVEIIEKNFERAQREARLEERAGKARLAAYWDDLRSEERETLLERLGQD